MADKNGHACGEEMLDAWAKTESPKKGLDSAR
jgi:hypothetical protein